MNSILRKPEKPLNVQTKRGIEEESLTKTRFGDILEAKKIGYGKIAKAIGVNYYTIRNYALGYTTPSLDHALAICDYLKIKYTELRILFTIF